MQVPSPHSNWSASHTVAKMEQVLGPIPDYPLSLDSLTCTVAFIGSVIAVFSAIAFALAGDALVVAAAKLVSCTICGGDKKSEIID